MCLAGLFFIIMDLKRQKMPWKGFIWIAFYPLKQSFKAPNNFARLILSRNLNQYGICLLKSSFTSCLIRKQTKYIPNDGIYLLTFSGEQFAQLFWFRLFNTTCKTQVSQFPKHKFTVNCLYGSLFFQGFGMFWWCQDKRTIRYSC